MQSRKPVIAILALVLGVAAWYAFRPERLFINQKVSEALPAQAAAMQSDLQPKKLLVGGFHTNAHKTDGIATIYELPNGMRVLRFTQFETSNGPDVHIYLVAANDLTDNSAKEAGFIDLGSIKGNIGDQNYELPAGVDLAKYRAVTVWCARFNVNFGTAPLMPAMGSDVTDMPAAALSGRFHTNAHKTEGTAAIYTLAGGERVLRLTNFETSNGPDVHVYLVAKSDLTDNSAKEAGFVDLGSIKGNIGDQNYSVPADVDLAKYRAVTIWCARFNVNFGTAPLSTTNS